MKRSLSQTLVGVATVVGFALLGLSTNTAQAQAPRKPNILVIWGDYIGYWNVSAYSQGMMGYKTPNIDRKLGLDQNTIVMYSTDNGAEKFVKEQVLKGMKVGNKTFKVHLDGYNLTDALAGKAPGGN